MNRQQPTRAALRAAKLLRHYGSSVSLSGAAGFSKHAGHPQALALASRLIHPPKESSMPTATALSKPTPRASISKGAAGGPWLRIKQNKLYTDVTLTVELAEGQWTSFHARIDHAMIRKLLERGGVEIGFSLGGIWKGIKKVAKATGVTKVLSIASKVLKNPIVTAVFPVASIAARATEAGMGMLSAATRAKKGTKADKVAAATLIQASHKKAKGGDIVQKKAMKMLSRTYRIVVEPLAISGDPLNAFDQAA